MKETVILFIIILVLFVSSCQTQNPELDYSNCPQLKCPNLDCSMCPKQTETKVVTKYQCYDGSIRYNEEQCPKTLTEEAQEDCPELNMFKPKQNIFDKDLYSIDYEEGNVYAGWTIQCGFTCSTNCKKGQEEGENVNNYYCGKSTFDTNSLKKTITDINGEVLQVITKNVIIVFDKSLNYVETICGS